MAVHTPKRTEPVLLEQIQPPAVMAEANSVKERMLAEKHQRAERKEQRRPVRLED